MAEKMNYTSIEQSKKLLELGLNPETADMYYEPSIGFCTEPSEARVGEIKYAHPRSIPCWSLGALLDVMPDKIEYMDSECDLSLAKDWVSYEGYDRYDTSYTIQPMVFKDKPLVDLLFESIIWLLENGYIKKGK